MALSKEDADLAGIFRRSMAYRVKYRVGDGKKTKVPLERLAVHPLNRGSVYPNGDRVKGLGLDLLTEGFCEDEADHEGARVQEVPTHEQQNYPAVAGSSSADPSKQMCAPYVARRK